MAGGNLKNICQALISIRVPPKTLPTKEKLNNNAYDNGIKNGKGELNCFGRIIDWQKTSGLISR